MRTTCSGRGINLRRFLKDDVRVRAAHSGGHYSGSSRALAGPFPQLGVDIKWGGWKINFRIRRSKVKTGRQLSMLERKDRLYDAGNCRCGIEVTHIGFY